MRCSQSRPVRVAKDGVPDHTTVRFVRGGPHRTSETTVGWSDLAPQGDLGGRLELHEPLQRPQLDAKIVARAGCGEPVVIKSGRDEPLHDADVGLSSLPEIELGLQIDPEVGRCIQCFG